MADTPTPAEVKELFEIAKLAIKANPEYDQATREQKLAEQFQNAASHSRMEVWTLKGRDTANGALTDDKLTENEVVRANAMLKAYDEASKNAGGDVSVLYDKVEKLTEKYKTDPKIVKQSRIEFAQLQKNYPDSNPADGSIDINEVAKNELDFLAKTFPENMKKANDDVQKQNDSGTTLNPLETLGKIADSVMPAIKR